MWTAQTEPVDNGRRVKIHNDGKPVDFCEYLRLLESNQDFAVWYTNLLAEVEYEAFFWEHPPLCDENIDSEVEFVLLGSPSLARLAPDPLAFNSHFKRDSQDDVAVFRSLGGDAVLLAPRPSGPLEAYVHLAAFVRHARESQIESLWRETGRVVRQRLSERNLWLSTSGLGVSWLHVRLDTYPKYYQHRPYATGR
ncbi:MAG: hypothetical protein ACE5OQ_06170 [Woeseia sp.]